MAQSSKAAVKGQKKGRNVTIGGPSLLVFHAMLQVLLVKLLVLPWLHITLLYKNRKHGKKHPLWKYVTSLIKGLNQSLVGRGMLFATVITARIN